MARTIRLLLCIKTKTFARSIRYGKKKLCKNKNFAHTYFKKKKDSKTKVSVWCGLHFQLKKAVKLKGFEIKSELYTSFNHYTSSEEKNIHCERNRVR